jgi:hypothetical protein
MWVIHRLAIEEGRRLLIPAIVVAQAWRDARRQVQLSRFLHSCEVLPIGMETAKAAGVLCGKAGTRDVVDAAQSCSPAIRATSLTSGLRRRPSLGWSYAGCDPFARRHSSAGWLALVATATGARAGQTNGQRTAETAMRRFAWCNVRPTVSSWGRPPDPPLRRWRWAGSVPGPWGARMRGRLLLGCPQFLHDAGCHGDGSGALVRTRA